MYRQNISHLHIVFHEFLYTLELKKYFKNNSHMRWNPSRVPWIIEYLIKMVNILLWYSFILFISRAFPDLIIFFRSFIYSFILLVIQWSTENASLVYLVYLVSVSHFYVWMNDDFWVFGLIKIPNSLCAMSCETCVFNQHAVVNGRVFSSLFLSIFLSGDTWEWDKIIK